MVAMTKSNITNTGDDGIPHIISHVPVNDNASESKTNMASTLEAPDTNKKERQSQSENQDKSKPARIQELLGFMRWFITDQWFLLAMAALIIISSQIQVPDAQQHVKRVVVTYLSVSVIFFVNGCTFPTRVLIENWKRWKLHLFVQLQCYLVTSAATFAIVSLCATNPNFSMPTSSFWNSHMANYHSVDPWLLIGLLFVGSAPTTMSSNVVMTRQAHGNSALTVVQSIIGQCLCPFLSPILLQMYLSSGAWYSKAIVTVGDNYGEIYRRVFMQLGITVFIPLVAGQLVQYVFPKVTRKIFFDWKWIKLSSIALLSIVWQTFDQAFRSGAFDSIKISNKIFVVFANIVLYFVWLGICFSTSIMWLPRKDVIACCYCVPAKALAMIVPLSSVMYLNIKPIEQSKMQIPAIIFQTLQVGIGGLCTIGFRKWVKPVEEREAQDKLAGAGA